MDDKTSHSSATTSEFRRPQTEWDSTAAALMARDLWSQQPVENWHLELLIALTDRAGYIDTLPDLTVAGLFHRFELADTVVSVFEANPQFDLASEYLDFGIQLCGLCFAEGARRGLILDGGQYRGKY